MVNEEGFKRDARLLAQYRKSSQCTQELFEKLLDDLATDYRVVIGEALEAVEANE